MGDRSGPESLPRLPTGAGARLALLLLALLPVCFLPLFHDAFTSSKILLVLALGVPAYLILARPGRPDPIAGYRRLFAVFVPLLLLVAVVRTGGVPWQAVPWLAHALFPLLFLQAGAGLARDQGGRNLPTLAWAVGLSLALVLAIGSLRRLTGWPASLPDRLDVGLASTIGNSNALAEFAAPAALFVLLLVARPGRAPDAGTTTTVARWTSGLVPASAAGLLVLESESRAGLLALGAGLLVLALTAWLMRGGRPLLRKTALVAAGALLVGGALFLANPALRPRLTSALDPDHPTNRVRLEVWDGTLDLIADRFPLGTGAGGFEAGFPPYRSAREWDLSGAATQVEAPHDEVLWVLAEGGVAGLAFLAGIVILSGMILSRAARSKDPDLPYAVPFAAGMIAAFAVVSLVRSPWQHPSGVLVPAVVMGALAAATGTRPRTPVATTVTWALVLLATLALALGLVQDARLLSAREALVEVDIASGSGDAALLGDRLQSASRKVREAVGGTPPEAARLYRASQVAKELARTRGALAASPGTPPELLAELPDGSFVAEVLRRVLALQPFHAQARMNLALVNLGRGHRAEAVQGLKDLIEAVPATPGARDMLARIGMEAGLVAMPRELLEAELRLHPGSASLLTLGRLTLSLGNDARTAGFWMAGSAAPDELGAAAVTRARAVYEAGDRERARIAVLEHLARHPRDLNAWYLLEQILIDLRADPLREAEKNATQARHYLLYAVDAWRLGKRTEAERNLRLARTRDRELLDVRVLDALLADDAGDREAATRAVDDLVERGLRSEDFQRLFAGRDLLLEVASRPR